MVYVLDRNIAIQTELLVHCWTYRLAKTFLSEFNQCSTLSTAGQWISVPQPPRDTTERSCPVKRCTTSSSANVVHSSPLTPISGNRLGNVQWLLGQHFSNGCAVSESAITSIPLETDSTCHGKCLTGEACSLRFEQVLGRSHVVHC